MEKDDHKPNTAHSNLEVKFTSPPVPTPAPQKYDASVHLQKRSRLRLICIVLVCTSAMIVNVSDPRFPRCVFLGHPQAITHLRVSYLYGLQIANSATVAILLPAISSELDVEQANLQWVQSGESDNSGYCKTTLLTSPPAYSLSSVCLTFSLQPVVQCLILPGASGNGRKLGVFPATVRQAGRSVRTQEVFPSWVHHHRSIRSRRGVCS